MLRLLLGLIRPQTGTADLICGDTRYPLSAKTRGAFAYVPLREQHVRRNHPGKPAFDQSPGGRRAAGAGASDGLRL